MEKAPRHVRQMQIVRAGMTGLVVSRVSRPSAGWKDKNFLELLSTPRTSNMNGWLISRNPVSWLRQFQNI